MAANLHQRAGRCFVLLLVAFVFAGCQKARDVKQQMTDLEKAFPSLNSPAPAQPESAQVPAAPTANTYVNAALAAARTNDYAGGVIALQAVQKMPGITAPQLMAIEHAKQAMTGELVSKAAGGDAKAKADLAVIERTLSQ